MGNDHPQISMAYLPPTPRQTRAALAGAAFLLLAIAVLIPFADKPLPKVNGFIPALDAIIFVTDLITAGLLLAHFSITRSRALSALAYGYLFSAAIVVANGLTFPNFRIYLLWHLGLPVALFAYVWLRDKDCMKASAHMPTKIVGTVGVVGVFALISCIACLALLPPVDPVAGRWLTVITMLICVAALAVLWVFQRSALDQWLMVVVLTMIVELAITALVGGIGPRIVSLGFYSLGFYTGRLVSLVTSTVVLIALLAETSRLYRMEEQFNERTRIARELHDTLLQSFQGVAFQIQAARKLLLRKADTAEGVLDEAILATEEAIREGRSAIRDLRPEQAAERNFPELLNAVGLELATAHELNGHAPSYRVVVEGQQQDLSPMIEDEFYRISREAIRNAFAHAVANHIEVEIRYDQDQLRLRFRDDGRGIDPKSLEEGGRPGHWGISGMRERAQRIGAQLAFWSEIGAGTEVQLTVAGAIAYEKHRDGHRFRLFRRAGSDEQRS